MECGEGRRVREVRWQELTKQECFELLAGQHLGRVVLVDDRGPLALPVNFVVDDYTVLFRTDEGTKLDVASRGPRGGRRGHRPDRAGTGAGAAAVSLGTWCQDSLCPDPSCIADWAADRAARGRAVDLVGLAATSAGGRVHC